MNPAEVGQRWRCEGCAIPLSYTELFQDSDSGRAFCVTCWLEMSSRPAIQPAIICEECYALIPPGIIGSMEHWMGVRTPLRVCDDCATPLTPDEEDAAISSLLKLMEDTDEEG